VQDERGANKAAAKVNYAGQVYYFCSESCHKALTAEPQKYAGSASHGSGSRHHGHQ
jgi:YHS domain-containing protein